MAAGTSRAVLALVLFAAGTSRAQAPATIRGHVRSARTGTAIAGATVFIVGTRKGAIADSGGAYAIADVAPSRVTIHARALGYADGSDTVDVRAGESIVVDFRLDESITTLGAVRSQAKAADR